MNDFIFDPTVTEIGFEREPDEPSFHGQSRFMKWIDKEVHAYYRLAYYPEKDQWLGIHVFGKDEDGKLMIQDLFNFITIDSQKFGKDLLERLMVI